MLVRVLMTGLKLWKLVGLVLHVLGNIAKTFSNFNLMPERIEKMKLYGPR
jgi:hypothetical protein